MIYLYLAIHDIGCIGATVCMVLTDNPWWALPFLVELITTTIVNRRR